MPKLDPPGNQAWLAGPNNYHLQLIFPAFETPIDVVFPSFAMFDYRRVYIFLLVLSWEWMGLGVAGMMIDS